MVIRTHHNEELHGVCHNSQLGWAGVGLATPGCWNSLALSGQSDVARHIVGEAQDLASASLAKQFELGGV